MFVPAIDHSSRHHTSILPSSADIDFTVTLLPTMILTSPIDLTKHVDLSSVNGKTALITGGANSDGIGFGVAEAMAQNGHV